jgi:alkanesulfonate monooxygenase SsuD/methylene tetrahydromethanopterin reductase-like flavin-dependent oxidoreductase (luciferase family)
MTPHFTLSLAGSGYHPASWRASRLTAGPNAAAFQAMAREAERAGLDAILLGLPVHDAAASGTVNTMRLDPLPLVGSLIGVTRRIGLAASWSVDYTEPFNVARVFATLDHLSYGRTAWLARMFETEPLVSRIGRPNGLDDVAAYCRRAGEFIDVVRKLLDSWEDEGLVLDKASGMFADPDHVHPINHSGPYFSVRGPLNVPRPPQGIPVLMMSDPATAIGRRFAAATADVILTDQTSSADAITRYQELQALAADHARPPGALRVLADINYLLGETEADACRRADTLDAFSPYESDGPRFVGTPKQLVELFATWTEQRACDGFNLLPAVLPDDVNLLVETVIPLARRRGLFRNGYDGETLREHLGLARPLSRYAERSRP